MDKIFDSEYRKDALALLIEADVEKEKAISVVSTKFYKALTDAAADVLQNMAENVRNGKNLGDVLKDNTLLKSTTGFESMTDVVGQLDQLHEYVEKIKKTETKTKAKGE